jgi:hypothetical protein
MAQTTDWRSLSVAVRVTDWAVNAVPALPKATHQRFSIPDSFARRQGVWATKPSKQCAIFFDSVTTLDDRPRIGTYPGRRAARVRIAAPYASTEPRRAKPRRLVRQREMPGASSFEHLTRLVCDFQTTGWRPDSLESFWERFCERSARWRRSAPDAHRRRSHPLERTVPRSFPPSTSDAYIRSHGGEAASNRPNRASKSDFCPIVTKALVSDGVHPRARRAYPLLTRSFCSNLNGPSKKHACTAVALPL